MNRVKILGGTLIFFLFLSCAGQNDDATIAVHNKCNEYVSTADNYIITDIWVKKYEKKTDTPSDTGYSGGFVHKVSGMTVEPSHTYYLNIAPDEYYIYVEYKSSDELIGELIGSKSTEYIKCPSIDSGETLDIIFDGRILFVK